MSGRHLSPWRSAGRMSPAEPAVWLSGLIVITPGLQGYLTLR
jgi:hypothetical protein